MNDRPIERAAVVVYDLDQNIRSYTYTESDGGFSMLFDPSGLEYVMVEANSMGFQKQGDTLHFIPGKKQYVVDFRLEEKVEQLKEVVLKPTEKISANGDVTTVQVEAFSDGTEQTVEDVLKNLPGIEVMPNGTIKAHGKPIAKLLIEGDDMFGSNYEVLSKNLDAKVLDAVEIIDHFQDNPVLAKVLDSKRVALNLKLKDKFKNIWFGNGQVGLGTEERVKAAANLGLIRKEIKFFYFGNYNNLGHIAAEQLEGSPTTIRVGTGYREKQIEPGISPIFSIAKRRNDYFKEGQSTFNKAFLSSLGFVTDLAPNLKLRGTAFFTNDDQEQLFSSETIYHLGGDPIRYSEKNEINRNKTIGAGELELTYSGGERSYLKNVLVYRNKPVNVENSLLFNQKNIQQELEKEEYSFYNHFNYSYYLGRNKVLHNYLYFGKNEVEQAALIRSPVLNELFALPDESGIRHFSKDNLLVFGVVSSLFSNFGDFEHKAGLTYESLEENRENQLNLPGTENPMGVDSLENHLVFRQQKLALNSSLSYSFSRNVELSGGFSLEYLDINTKTLNRTEWSLLPKMELKLELGLGYFRLSYERTHQRPNSILFLDNYQLSSYRSFVRGTNSIRFPERGLFGFYYKWDNELETKAFSLLARYVSTEGKYSTASQINQDFTLSTYRFVNGGDRFIGTLNFTSYFENLDFSTNLSSSQIWSTMLIKANSKDFMPLKIHSAQYKITGTTYFDMPVNFNFHLKTIRSQSTFNGAPSQTHRENAGLKTTYELSDEWHASLDGDYYQMERSDYYFLGATASYEPKKSPFSYRLMLNNLTDEDEFSRTEISEYTTYRSSVGLLPRYVFLSVKYRF